ncbi:acyl-CoA N-acyltransferase [Phlegmacium glaucopus]|nr:acyl-CoA N-acyltransferase [Phlegmacium glaucopus]
MAQPDPQGHGKLIRIRPYRPSDSEQIRRLFEAATLHGPMQVALDSQFWGPTACVSYCTLLLGLSLATFTTNLRIRCIGVALCIAGCALFATMRYIFSSKVTGGINDALNGNLKDIGKTFGMKPVVIHNGERTGEYVPSGTSGFWVAEAYASEKDLEVGDSETEIIGSVGLDANKNSDETSADLCRVMVSSDYRRRGIAASLIKTALRHAQNHGVTSVVLSTTMFQPAAIAVYEKLGWVLQRKMGVRILLDRVWILYYSLDLSPVKV